MPHSSQIRAEILASIDVKKLRLEDRTLLRQIEGSALECLDALHAGAKIIFAGNGGSFADAQHLSAEFVSRFKFDRSPLASLTLGTNNSAISAIANDYGYDQVFARELEAVASPGDVFIGISTSGNSLNIISDFKMVAEMGISTTYLTESSGGSLTLLCNCLRMPSYDTARIQECHITIGHIICGLIECLYFKKERMSYE